MRRKQTVKESNVRFRAANGRGPVLYRRCCPAGRHCPPRRKGAKRRCPGRDFGQRPKLPRQGRAAPEVWKPPEPEGPGGARRGVCVLWQIKGGRVSCAETRPPVRSAVARRAYFTFSLVTRKLMSLKNIEKEYSPFSNVPPLSSMQRCSISVVLKNQLQMLRRATSVSVQVSYVA